MHDKFCFFFLFSILFIQFNGWGFHILYHNIMICDFQDENNVFKVLDEDNDFYLSEIKCSQNLFNVTKDYHSTRKCDRYQKNVDLAAKKFDSFHAEVQSRYAAYKASFESNVSSLEERCSIVIQRYWRRHVDRKIFRRLRDLLMKYSDRDSSSILKLVNPREANLMDRASGTFIRFRLSGEIFPPIIVYKIFTSRPIVDLCRRDIKHQIFSDSKTSGSCEKKTSRTTKPDDFVKPRIHGAVKIGEDDKIIVEENAEIYERVDGNDWRPFLDSFTVQDKPQTLDLLQASTNKTLTSTTRTMRKRRLKLELIKRLYENGRRKELRERDT